MESSLINFNEGDNSSPDLPCGQKDWREVENKAEVHQARPNCHCQVDIYIHKKHPALNNQIKYKSKILRFTATHPICMETFKAHPQLGRFTLRDEGDFKLARYY